jgi:hypothetical protein
MQARVVPNDVALQTLLYGPQSGIARDLARRAVKVQNQAKLNASGRPGPNVDTGRLRSSIAWELREQDGRITARIGTNVEYGYYLETGLRNGATYPFLKPALSAARD